MDRRARRQRCDRGNYVVIRSSARGWPDALRAGRSYAAIVAATVLIAAGEGALDELLVAHGDAEVVGMVRSLSAAERAMRALRPSVLVLDCDLTHHGGLCSLPALRRASPETAIVLPPAGNPWPRLVRAVRIATRDSKRRRDDHGLTARERDVVRLLALGHTNHEIAERLVLSVRTVETHRSRIQRRLGLRSRAEVVRWALDRGMLAP
jgi:two-component system, NarL family, response regulator NreC